MKNQLHLVIAAAAFAFAAMLPDVGSAQFEGPSFPDCWQGSWGSTTSSTISRTCSNGFAGYAVTARVWNEVRHNGGTRWRTAKMQRTGDCHIGHGFLWINTSEIRLSDGASGPWWWRSNNTIKDCGFVLTRDAYNGNGHVIVNSRCRLEMCSNPH